MGLYIFIAIVCVLIVLPIVGYNRLVSARNQFKNAFSQIDVQLKRRHDLIPNLVETAKAYLGHEKGTLTAVIDARNNAQAARASVASANGSAASIAAVSTAETALSGSLGRFMALAEAYPDLKGNTNMQQLSEELSSCENRIAFSRQAYNDSVTDYNNSRESFPVNIIAGMFGFHSATLLESTTNEAERAVPTVKF